VTEKLENFLTFYQYFDDYIILVIEIYVKISQQIRIKLNLRNFIPIVFSYTEKGLKVVGSVPPIFNQNRCYVVFYHKRIKLRFLKRCSSPIRATHDNVMHVDTLCAEFTRYSPYYNANILFMNTGKTRHHLDCLSRTFSAYEINKTDLQQLILNGQKKPVEKKRKVVVLGRFHNTDPFFNREEFQEMSQG